jgi:hypothetical protein
MTDHSAVALELQKDTDKHSAKSLLFGALLILLHLIKIVPSEFDVAGLKITIDDVAIVRGSVAALFFYSFSMMAISSIQGQSVVSFKADKRTLRGLLRFEPRTRKDKETKRTRRRHPKEIKRAARISYAIYVALILPFVLGVLLVFFFGLLLSIYDIVDLMLHVVDRIFGCDVCSVH